MFGFYERKMALRAGQMENLCNNRSDPKRRGALKRRRRGQLKKYVKALLYSYPKMAQMEMNYQEHIFCKACFSFDNRRTGEFLAEELAGEVVKKQTIKELRDLIGRVVERFSEKERYLLELRYFRRKLKLKEFEEKYGKPSIESVRSYFRKQMRLIEKVERTFMRFGVTEEKMEEFMRIDELKAVYLRLCKGKDKRDKTDKITQCIIHNS